METLTLRRPDDCHHHLRDGAVLKDTAGAAAGQFARAIIMPNLVPPVTTLKDAQEYKGRILNALTQAGVPAGRFQPLMTLYLTDDTKPEEIKLAVQSGDVHAVKLYPAGATTNSAAGVTDYKKVYDVLGAMAQQGLPLCVHGEVTDPSVDIFDRERVFVKSKLPELLSHAPGLKVVLEHMSTREAVEFVESAGANVAGTITPQHLLANRNAMLVGGLRPHWYCLPILKTEDDRQALLGAVRRGCARVFLGTDSAPHAVGRKQSACGCAGVFSAHSALELYAEAFEEAGALDKLEAFASLHGAAFYGLPPNEERVTLQRSAWRVPEALPFGEERVVPLYANCELKWRIQGREQCMPC